MATAQRRRPEKGASRSKTRTVPGDAWIHSTRVHVVLYSFLLVFTPFIVLQNFLMDFLSTASARTISLGLVELPAVVLIGGIVIVALAIVFRRHINRRLLAGLAIAVLMDALAQQISDFYFGQKFYNLLNNWHYIAYALFAPMMYRDLSPRGVRFSRILWVTFFCAVGFSTFDEFFQRYLSNRVFDLSDTAKDVWGCVMGLVVVSMYSRLPELKEGWKRLRHSRPREQFDNPLSVLILMAAFGLVFLSCASLLSEPEYPPLVALLSIGISALALAVYLALFYRPTRIAVGVLALAGVLALGYNLVRHHGEQIALNRYGLTVYRGMPIPFFDVMIFPDGHYRLVDKKHSFTQRDQKRMLSEASDIILIGSGEKGLGGGGFPETAMVQFLRNPYSNGITQVIILKTPEACRVFNRLKQEGKNVLFVLHNTC